MITLAGVSGDKAFVYDIEWYMEWKTKQIRADKVSTFFLKLMSSINH